MTDFNETSRHAGTLVSCLAVSITLMLLAAGTAFGGEDQGQIEILVGTASGGPGDDVDLGVELVTNGEQPSVIVAKLVYDAVQLSFVDVEAGEAATQAGKSVAYDNKTPGLVSIVVFGGTSAMADGNLLTVTFAISGAAPPGVLTIAGDGSESVAAPDGTRIPVVLEQGSIMVSNCPAAPAGVSASDGKYTNKVRVTWNAAARADQYRVYRDGTAIGNWQSATTYDDYGAQAAEVVSRCGAQPEITYHKHTYTVKAKNSCGESDFGSADTGYRGASKALDADLKVYEEALPSSNITPFSELAVRLTSAESIDPATVWARVEGDGWTEEGGLWRPTTPGDDSDGWVVFAPAAPWPADETVTLTAGALAVTGVEVGPISREFHIGTAIEAAASGEPTIVEMSIEEGLPALGADVVSPAYRIGPNGVFGQPVSFWIPVPEGADPDALEIYYFSETEEHRGWYPAENVIGWMAPDSRAVVEEDGQFFIEILVNHSGIVQLADAQSAKVLADAGILLAFVALLGMKLARHNRNK